ncbi:MAG: putative sugar nucleotidyl transferase, partial [Salegentibacter mishustinae]|nr:putative sugar nucleotidyl transferase [Salegentibacter mishustinae]
MTNYILFDGPARNNLLPFTFTRPVADIRVGILTIREKWERILGIQISTSTQDYLSEKWPLTLEEHNIFINAAIIPNAEFSKQVQNLEKGEKLVWNDLVVAYYQEGNMEADLSALKSVEAAGGILHINNTWNIFSKNSEAISLDFELITKGRVSQEIHPSNYVKSAENIFIEEGAEV